MTTTGATLAHPLTASLRLASRVTESTLELSRAAAETWVAYWSQAATSGYAHAGHDLARWLQVTSSRQPPRWHTPNTVVEERPVSLLRDFGGRRPKASIPALLLPPQAGHHSCIVDYSPEQSQVSAALEAGLDRLYALEWLPATQATKHCSIEDYVEAVAGAVAVAGGRVHLVGDCQGGWLATLYAALHPEQVATLTVAGAPIDFHAGQAPIADYVSMPSAGGTLEPYRAAVRSANGVLHGQFLVGGFIALKPEDEWRKHLELLLNLDDPAFVERYAHFEDWLKHPQAIPGAFYLWILEELFVGNRLVQGSVRVAGEAAALGRIACPVTMIAGTADHITPPEQVFALAGHVATPARRRTEITVEAGHLGLFMSRTALAEVWLPTFGRLAAG